MKGYVHSQESFGTVDGPGLRYVVFMQGCPMRCKYCHNPDTWKMSVGNEIEAKDIIARYNRNKAFYKNGGITITGGEPLVQVDFLIELFQLAKKENIHTCIDTSGITYNPNNLDYIEKLNQLMSLTDLVMLDIKHIDSYKHKELTQHDNQNILLFTKYLEEKNIPVWIRHVVVPTISDDPEDLKELGRFIGKLKNLKALDVLPYHTMGVNKYEQLGIAYPLEGLESLPKEKVIEARNFILEGIKEIRKN